MSDDRVDEIINQLQLNIIEKEKLRDSVYKLLSADNNQYILKLAPPKPKGKLRRILRFFTKGSVAFQNECLRYSAFEKHGDMGFNYPDLIETDYKSYLVLEYIPGVKYWRNIKACPFTRLIKIWIDSRICRSNSSLSNTW